MSTDTLIQQLSSHLQTHHHLHHQLIFGLQGHADFQLEGPGGQRVNPAMACLVPSDCRHAFQGVGHNRMLIVNIEPMASMAHPRVLEQVFAQPCYLTLDAEFMRLLRVVAVEASEHSQDHWYGQHLSASLIHGLYHRMVAAESLPVQADRVDLHRIDLWLDAHLAQKIEVAQLAELCHLSTSQFQLLFQQKIGLSAYQYVIRKRLDTATWLLRNSQMRIADIALEVGFAHQSAMTKAFRLYRGSTPVLIRNQLNLH